MAATRLTIISKRKKSTTSLQSEKRWKRLEGRGHGRNTLLTLGVNDIEQHLQLTSGRKMGQERSKEKATAK